MLPHISYYARAESFVRYMIIQNLTINFEVNITDMNFRWKIINSNAIKVIEIEFDRLNEILIELQIEFFFFGGGGGSFLKVEIIELVIILESYCKFLGIFIFYEKFK